MKRIDLCGDWTGKCIFPDKRDFEFDGAVPGSAIFDLINAERLPRDIFWRDNADAVAEFEPCDYVYKKKFDFEGESRGALLRFERIDTYADVYLNGKKVYHSENGNIRHDIDVEDALLQGENLVEVHLYSPSVWVKDMPLRYGAFTRERMNTRRMQCTYGWDWVARFLTCSLGECSLLLPEEGKIFTENVYIATLDIDGESATVRADVCFEQKYSGRILDFEILSPEGKIASAKKKYCAEDFVRIDFDIPAPRLWYPLGYGEQPLYTFLIKDGEGTVYRETFGIRTVKIMQLPDEKGGEVYKRCLEFRNEEYDKNEIFSGFVLKINGKKVFCRGGNWVPCVPFTGENVDSRQSEILELCAEAGVNMIRVWGGGAFESKHFYSECSRLGIMVTQDFLMACGAYPEDEDWFIAQLQKEARYAARLIRNQPCLVWWTGDNENAVRGCDTDENYRGRRSAYEGIAPVLYREDPHRRFLPSSPFGGELYASNTVGTTHNSQYLGRFFKYILNEDMSDYKEELKKYRARFIVEEPQMGAASVSSLRRFMTDEDIFDGVDMWHYHTKSNPRLEKDLFDYLRIMTEKILGEFSCGRDRLFKLRYMQYEWVRTVMEQARRERAICSGIVFWMMNDCWPASSGWALIDFYNLPKDSFYSFKRCAAPVLASLDFEDGSYRAYVINDGDEKEIKVSIKVLAKDRRTVKTVSEFSHIAKKDSSDIVFESENLLGEGEVLVCEIEGDYVKDRAFYRHGALALRPTEAEFEIDEVCRTVTVRAGAEYIHSAMLSGNAIFDDNCFSLLPGEARTVAYRPLKAGSPECIEAEAYTLV